MEEETHFPSLVLSNTEEQASGLQIKSFAEYKGQHELKTKLELYTKAAKLRDEPIDHLLLFGPPGLGKTTLSQIMAHEMDVGIKICSGPMLERTGDLVAMVSNMESKDILFIDEIHRMPTAVEEVLYSAMEHFRVDVIIGQGAGAKSVNLPINPFTLVGATTQTGMLSAPLRSRFGIIERIDFYAADDLADIVTQNAHHVDIDIAHDAAIAIGQSARGTPRIAKSIFRRVRDFAQIKEITTITPAIVEEAMTFLGIDKEGLTDIDHRLINAIAQQFEGGPVGVETLASIIGEDTRTLEEVYEPFLIRQGYLEKTPRGRRIPVKRYREYAQKAQGQQTLL